MGRVIRMKASRKWGLVAVAVVGIALAAAVFWLPSADSVREHLRDELARATGRAVSIDGLDWAWSPTPVLILSGVSIANASWGRAPAFAHLPKVVIHPRLSALLKRRVVLDKLSLERPSVFVETRADGERNWVDFDSDAQTRSSNLSLEVGDVRVRDARLELRHAQGVDHYLMTEMLLSAQGNQHRIEMTVADGGGKTWLSTQGTLANLRAWGAVPLQVDVSFDAGNDTVAGSYVGALDREKLNGQVVLKATSVALGKASNVWLEGEVTGQWSRVRVQSTRLSLRHGAERSTGHTILTIDRRGPRPLLSGTLSLDRIALPASESGTATRDVHVALPDLAFDIDIDVAIDALDIGHLALRRMHAVVSVEPAQLRVTQAAATLGGGQVTGHAMVHAKHAAKPQVNLTLTLEQVPSSALLAEAQSASVRTRVDGRIDVKVHGERLAQWPEVARGSVRLASKGGEVKVRAVENLVGGVPALLESLVMGHQEWVHLNCAVVAVDFADSVANATAIVVDTPNTTLVVEGHAQLPRGPLALLLTPHPKSATLNISVPIRISGPIDEPSYAPEEAAAARRVGGLLAGFVFPPALIAAFADFGYASAGCVGGRAASAVVDGSKVLGQASAATETIAREAAQVAREASEIAADVAKEAGTAASQAGNAASKAVEGALKEVGKTLKGWFGE
jgi:uncharacterized protein involved in outer membrane biogenesis